MIETPLIIYITSVKHQGRLMEGEHPSISSPSVFKFALVYKYAHQWVYIHLRMKELVSDSRKLQVTSLLSKGVFERLNNSTWKHLFWLWIRQVYIITACSNIYFRKLNESTVMIHNILPRLYYGDNCGPSCCYLKHYQEICTTPDARF